MILKVKVRTMTMEHLSCGQTAKIISLPLTRMEELGLTPGTLFRLIKKGPGKTPLHITFKGCDLLIDRHTAAKTEIEPCEFS